MDKRQLPTASSTEPATAWGSLAASRRRDSPPATQRGACTQGDCPTGGSRLCPWREVRPTRICGVSAVCHPLGFQTALTGQQGRSGGSDICPASESPSAPGVNDSASGTYTRCACIYVHLLPCPVPAHPPPRSLCGPVCWEPGPGRPQPV